VKRNDHGFFELLQPALLEVNEAMAPKLRFPTESAFSGLTINPPWLH
jgi:hypothetical protein